MLKRIPCTEQVGTDVMQSVCALIFGLGHARDDRSRGVFQKPGRPKSVGNPTAVRSSFPNARQPLAEKKSHSSPPRRQRVPVQRSPLCENLMTVPPSIPLESDSDTSSDSEINMKANKENRRSGKNCDTIAFITSYLPC